MKIQGLGGFAGPGMVDSILESEKLPINAAKERKDHISSNRNEFKTFDGLLDSFGKSLDSIKTKRSFTKLSLESSHPELLEGSISAFAQPGSYEFEIEGVAKQARELGFGFADKDKTPVGFGFMKVGVGNAIHDITIPPGSTLQDVAQKINENATNVKAMVINTGDKEDPFRLMVSSLESGKEAVLNIDPDTTFNEFKGISNPQDLKVKFEGVDVRRAGNKLDDLIDGVSLNAKRAEPGTRIQVDVKQDIDQTSQGIKDFVKQYNEISSFARNQSVVNPSTGKAGPLSGDSALRASVRQLQGNISNSRVGKDGPSLADIGITTDPHSGSLSLDETKLKDALTKNYDGVASVFANSEQGPGIAQKLSETIHQLRDRSTGAVSQRLKGMDQRIKQQEQAISRSEERLADKRKHLEKTFASLDAKMAGMQNTSEFLGARFGGGSPMPEAAPAQQSQTGAGPR